MHCISGRGRSGPRAGSAWRGRGAGALLALLCMAPRTGQASFAELFDLGPAMGRAGAVSATTDSGAAVYYNPAGLAFRRAPQLRLGIEGARSELRLRRQRVPISSPMGLLVEVATPVPLLGWLDGKLALGAALHLIPDTLLRIDSPSSTEPTLPYYENRSQRLLALAGLAFRPHPRVAVGIGVNYFAGLLGSVGGAEGAYRDMQAEVQEEIVGVAAPNAGLRFELDALELGLTYRGELAVPFETVSRSVVAGSTFDVAIRADALYSPETLVLGAAYRAGVVTASIDLSWRRWSRYRPLIARVEADVPVVLSTAGETFHVESEVEPQTRDVVRAAAGLRGDPWEGWSVTAGYAFESSAFPAQSGPTNLVDGPKHILGLGASWHGPRLAGLSWAVELAVQAHWMQATRLVKDPSLLPDEEPSLPGRQTTNPGYPSVAGGGLALAASLSLMFELQPGPDEGSP